MTDQPTPTAHERDAIRLNLIREHVAAYRPDRGSAPTTHAVEDMKFLLAQVDDLRSRLACIAEATYWDRPYDTRIDAIRGMCDLTTNGMTPKTEVAGR